MDKLPLKYIKAILLINKLIGKNQYALRGTTSLVLHKIDMNVDDIDIICNKKTALACNKILKNYLIEKVIYSESEKFKSYFGKFKISDVDIEVMGDWQIKKQKGAWSRVYDASEFEFVEIEGIKIPVTSIKTELQMFQQMGRWNAYNKIKQGIKRSEQQQMDI